MTSWKAKMTRPFVGVALTVVACMGGFIAPWPAAMKVEGTGLSSVPNLEIGNQYIKVFVNATDDGTARFAVDSTGGDPLNDADDDKPLVYGRPCPWTSYTTVRVDGEDYVFGGRTQRRPGGTGNYGTEVVAPAVSGDSIVAAWRFGDIEVSQVLSIVRSTTTGLLDTARITYVATNLGSIAHEVGLRMMLDTMLGANDGAPFRAGDRAIVSDTVLGSNEMPRFWQAFDSLSSPSVTSQGTLGGSEVTTPDRVLFTNWGSLADGVWDTDVSPGRDFTRTGEYELDSAIAMYWDPRPLAPGESMEFTTLYGMGGISVAPGVLSIGVTSPAEVTLGRDRPATFPVVAYVENSGPTVALNVRVAIELPKGLALAAGEEAGRAVGDLRPGETAQVAWEIVPDVLGQADLEYSVAVEAENAEANRVRRSVRVLAPPDLRVRVEAAPEFTVKDDQFDPGLLRVKAVIENVGGAPAYGVKAVLALGQGIRLAEREKASRFPSTVSPGERWAEVWQIAPSGQSGDFDYVVKVESRSAEERFATGRVRVPELASRILVQAPTVMREAGEFFTVDVVGRNLAGLEEMRLDVRFDPSILEAVFVSKGTAFVDENAVASWEEGVIDNSTGVVKGVSGRFRRARDVTGILATISFRARTPGACHILLQNVLLARSGGAALPVSVQGASVTVRNHD